MHNEFSNAERAEVLTAALPYIKKYSGKVVLIKYGGNAMQTRSANNCYDLANFAIVLANTPLKNGETYSYSITADLYTFDHIKVHEGTFTNG